MQWNLAGVWGGQTASSSGTFTSTTGPLRSPDILLCALGHNGLHTVSAGPTLDQGSGTFQQLATVDHAGGPRRLRLYIGYGFSGLPSAISITCAGSGSPWFSFDVNHLVTDRNWVGWTPAYTASTGQTGTGTAPDSGAVTPAVGDLLFAGGIVASSGTTWSLGTSTGNTYKNLSQRQVTNILRTGSAIADAASAVSSKHVFGINNSIEWAAIQAMLTPPAGAATPAAAAVYKGRMTYALDAAAEA